MGRTTSQDVLVSIVDDDESMRKALKRLVEAFGLSVEDYASAEDFLHSGLARQSSCLILDVRLPGMSGLELQSQLIARHQPVPIVFISAQVDERARVRAFEGGAVAFLQKPFGGASLIDAIDACLAVGGDRATSTAGSGDRKKSGQIAAADVGRRKAPRPARPHGPIENTR